MLTPDRVTVCLRSPSKGLLQLQARHGAYCTARSSCDMGYVCAQYKSKELFSLKTCVHLPQAEDCTPLLLFGPLFAPMSKHSAWAFSEKPFSSPGIGRKRQRWPSSRGKREWGELELGSWVQNHGHGIMSFPDQLIVTVPLPLQPQLLPPQPWALPGWKQLPGFACLWQRWYRQQGALRLSSFPSTFFTMVMENLL